MFTPRSIHISNAVYAQPARSVLLATSLAYSAAGLKRSAAEPPDGP